MPDAALSVATSRRQPFELSWFDRFLIRVAPGWGLSRVRSRAAATTLARYYEAASGGRRTSGWRRQSGDANSPLGKVAELRELSRDLRRNNGWARRGIQVIANNTIGWGIVAKAVAEDPALAQRAVELWNSWADSTACDFDGRMSFYGLQRLVMETVVESGEALVLRQPGGEQDGLPVPLRIQVIEPDYLDASRVSRGGNEIVQGVEFDASGRRVAYWLHPRHPHGSSLAGRSNESRRVPAESVLHIYQVDRPGQARGVPWLASAIARLQDFDDYADAVLMQQKVAACFAAFVQDFDGAATPLGDTETEDDKIESLEPGHIQYLPAGKTVTFASPPPLSDHTTFTTTNLRRIAASLGVTYEDLSGDYSQVNFSSARMGRLAHYANVNDWRWNMIVPQLCDGVFRWVMDVAAAFQEWPETPHAEWAPPPMPMLEPEKEGLAYQRLMRTGVMTLYEVLRERGEDPETHLVELAACNKRLDELGIWLDSDPRRTSDAGLTQARAGVASGGDDDGERALDNGARLRSQGGRRR